VTKKYPKRFVCTGYENETNYWSTVNCKPMFLSVTELIKLMSLVKSYKYVVCLKEKQFLAESLDEFEFFPVCLRWTLVGLP